MRNSGRCVILCCRCECRGCSAFGNPPRSSNPHFSNESNYSNVNRIFLFPPIISSRIAQPRRRDSVPTTRRPIRATVPCRPIRVHYYSCGGPTCLSLAHTTVAGCHTNTVSAYAARGKLLLYSTVLQSIRDTRQKFTRNPRNDTVVTHHHISPT